MVYAFLGCMLLVFLALSVSGNFRKHEACRPVQSKSDQKLTREVSMTEPSEGPWKVMFERGCYWVIAPPPERSQPLQFNPPTYVARCDELVDALFIGDACNHLNSLKEALQRLVADLSGGTPETIGDSVKNAKIVLEHLEAETKQSARALAKRRKRSSQS